MIGLGGYTDYGKKPDKKKGEGSRREEAKILRKRKQDDRWGRDGRKGGEGQEREIEGNRGRGSLGTLILLVKQNYLWRISFVQKLWSGKPETIISGLG